MCRCRAGLGHVRVIAKVCTPEAVVRAKEIIAAADGVVLGRGTLGLELPAEKVFYAQKALLRAANLAGKVCRRSRPVAMHVPGHSLPAVSLVQGQIADGAETLPHA